MRTTRIYEPQDLTLQGSIQLSPNNGHYLAHVMRCKPGQQISIFNGLGVEYLAEITSIKRKEIWVQLLSQSSAIPESPLKTTLVQGISKGERMDYTIQKTVELGINRIIPVETQFSMGRLNEEKREKKRHHWQMIAHSACAQSGRQFLTHIDPVIHFNSVISSVRSSPENRLHLFFSTTEESNKLADLTPHQEVQFFVGPEGGHSDIEERQLIDFGYIPVSLGPRIVRTETAAVAALAQMQLLWGDM